MVSVTALEEIEGNTAVELNQKISSEDLDHGILLVILCWCMCLMRILNLQRVPLSTKSTEFGEPVGYFFQFSASIESHC